MIRCESLIQSLSNEFSTNHSKSPKLVLVNQKDGKDGYSLSYAGGIFTLTSGDPHSIIYGISSLKIAIASCHVAEFLGDYKPKYSLRPLWIKEIELEGIGGEHKVEIICKRMLLLGYNAAIFELAPEKLSYLDANLAIFQEYGIQLIFKPIIDKTRILSPVDPNFSSSIQTLLKPILETGKASYILGDASIYIHHNTPFHVRDMLHCDLAKLETQKLEEILNSKCRLIYYLPSLNEQIAEKQSKWIPNFSKTVSEKTIIAYSANTGDPLDDHLPPHPLWNVLRNSKHASKYNLLPLVNIGLANQGEGFWPTISLDQINRYIVRCNPIHFSGAAAITAHLPKEDALLSCSLWLASQILWGKNNPHLLLESWIKAYRPEFFECLDPREVLEDCRKIEVQLGMLSSLIKENRTPHSKEEFRMLTESLLANLRLLHSIFDTKKTNSTQRCSLYERFAIFARDARKLILRFLQHFNMPLVNVMNGDDMQESFWADISNTGSLGMTSSVKVILRDKPNKGKPDSYMSKIYAEIETM
jgi:hypothetical protein